MEHSPTWLTHSLIYLAAAVVAVPLSRALGLGAIIGYLGAGIVIGPWGMGLVTEVDSILHFAEFGVVLMLFLVGLELDPQRLWTMRRPIFAWGSVQVLACTAVVFVAALAWGAPWRGALVAALGLSLSSTAIALQVMGERNLLPTASGQAGFSILLFQDIAAIPMLALLPLLGVAGASAQAGPAEHAQEILRIVAVIVGIVAGGRLLVRPLFRWIATRGTPEIFTATALLLVVGTASLMQWVGLSMGLGAFLAGVLLAESEYRRELETDIEPFKGLLLGLFFIAVGMSIDFGVLLAQLGQVTLIVLGFLTLKLAAMLVLAGPMGIPWQERPVFALLLAQGGEFAFVVFQAAAGSQVFSASTASLLVGSVALSMLISPVLLFALDRWIMPRMARDAQPALSELDAPQSAPVILVGFGRYGQIIGRLLLAEGVLPTVLDHDAHMVQVARNFGYQVFYGDATRLDLLRIAGAEQAKVLVVAVDDVEQSLEIVDLAREHFPRLELVVRARDATHWNQLRERGLTRVERELFESSLSSARSVLELLGFGKEEALRHADRFREHNLLLLEQMLPHSKDRARLIAVAQQGRQQLEEQLAREREQVAASRSISGSERHLQ